MGIFFSKNQHLNFFSIFNLLCCPIRRNNKCLTDSENKCMYECVNFEMCPDKSYLKRHILIVQFHEINVLTDSENEYV